MASLPGSSPYREFPVQDVLAAEIQVDPQRLFVVVSGLRTRTSQPWTLVFERRQDYWISRRDLNARLDPSSAVSGFLFNREGYQDPLDILRRMNEIVRAEHYGVLQDKVRVERARAELVEEVARLKGECEELKSRLRRKIGRGETTGRRAPAAPRKTSASRRLRRRR